RIVASKDLGGDVGNTSAIRLANYASWYAAQQNTPIGGVIPLVARQIAKEFYDRETRETHFAVSDKTIGTAVKRFIEHDVIATQDTTHTYEHDGVERTITVPGLVWRGRADLLQRFANGSVYAEGEVRRRGGKQEKRLPLVCPTCGETHAACVSCGTVFA